MTEEQNPPAIDYGCLCWAKTPQECGRPCVARQFEEGVNLADGSHSTPADRLGFEPFSYTERS